MKIGIVGAHGTGKTVLAKSLAEKLNLPLITEQARIVAKDMGLENLDGLINDKEKAFEFQKQVIVRQLAEEVNHLRTGFISDRTIIDNYAYWCYYGLDRLKIGSGLIKAIDFDSLYDLIIFVPIEFPVADDGFRFTCEACRNLIEKVIKTELENLIYTPVITVTGSLNERLNQALDVIKEMEDEL